MIWPVPLSLLAPSVCCASSSPPRIGDRTDLRLELSGIKSEVRIHPIARVRVGYINEVPT